MQAMLVAIAVIVVYFAVEGYRHGVVRRAVEAAGIIAVFVFASRAAGAVEPVLAEEFSLSDRTAFLASWITVLVAGIVAVRLAAAGMSKLFRFSVVGWIDRAGGVLLGGAFGAVLASCVLVATLAAPVDDDFKAELRDNAVTGPVLHLAPSVYDVVREVWHGESFFEMIREHVEPRARDAAGQFKALIEETDKDEATR